MVNFQVKIEKDVLFCFVASVGPHKELSDQVISLLCAEIFSQLQGKKRRLKNLSTSLKISLVI